MGAGSDCLKPKVRDNKNKNIEEDQKYDKDPYYSDGPFNNDNDIPNRKVIYGQNNRKNKSMYDAIFRFESINKLYHDDWTYTLYN